MRQNEDYLRKLYQYQLDGRKREFVFLLSDKVYAGKGSLNQSGRKEIISL